MKWLLPLMLLPVLAGKAQTAPVSKDTSFTIYSSYEKEVKKRPYITIASYPLSDKIIIQKDIVYRKMGERQLLLDLYYPVKHKKSRQAVLLIYGGGWKSGDKSQNETIARRLAEKGYIVFSPEYRLSPEAKYPAAVYDLKASVNWIRITAKQYKLKISSVTAWGFSAGGQLAALLGTTNNNKHFEDNTEGMASRTFINAVIDADGTLAFHHPESQESVAASLWFGGNYDSARVNWEEAAPLNHVSRLTPPFLFINSSTPRFHAGRDDMIRQLDSLHIYSEVHTLPDTPHPFWFFNPWFEPMMEYAEKFLKDLPKRYAEQPRF